LKTISIKLASFSDLVDSFVAVSIEQGWTTSSVYILYSVYMRGGQLLLLEGQDQKSTLTKGHMI